MSLYAERRCAAAVTLPDPWMIAQCALDVGHEGDHKPVIEWDDDEEDSCDCPVDHSESDEAHE